MRALPFDFLKRLIGAGKERGLSREALPAFDRNIDITGVDFDTTRTASGLLGGNDDRAQRTAAQSHSCARPHARASRVKFGSRPGGLNSGRARSLAKDRSTVRRASKTECSWRGEGGGPIYAVELNSHFVLGRRM